jgi:putative ABC transport system permease protein
MSMLTTPWKKVLLDLWEHRMRTLIVALAIAVGVYAVGVVLNTREILVREYHGDQAGALVPSAILHTQPFDDELAARLGKLSEVAAAEGRSMIRTRVYPEGQLPQDLVLIAVPDFSDMQVNAITPMEGAWPPDRREVALERLSFEPLGAQIGQEITVELDSGAVRTLTVTGSAHDPTQVNPDLAGATFGYITPETLAGLGFPETHTELRVLVTSPAHDEQHILTALNEVEDQLESSGRTILSREIITRSRVDRLIDTVVLILTGFGAIILLLSGFLVVNAMSALITQQIPQIGVMKLIGARRRQIMALYLATVLVYGLIAVAVALPLSTVTARFLMRDLVAPLLNVVSESYAVPLPLTVIQIAVGLLLPVLAGLAPVLRGTRITTQQALSDVGMGSGNYGRSFIERLLARLQTVAAIKRPVLLAIRNTLRHKGRLVQTLVVLIFGTALFVSVISVRTSVDATISSFMRFHQFDVSVQMGRPDLIARLEQAARETPGVVDLEVWASGHATRVRADNSKSDTFKIVAVPPKTTFMSPEITDGEWLPRDEGRAGIPTHNAIVVNSDLADDEPDIRLGSDIVLDIDGREATWRVIGIVPTDSRGSAVYVSRDDYAYAARTPGAGNLVQVKSDRHDAASQEELATLLYQHFDDLGLNVSGTETTQVIQAENKLLFTIVVAFLVLMALLLAAVGGLGLATTMSINMMERVREIGVLRAIGASSASVRQIVLAEGIAMAVISWGIGTLLSLFIAPALSSALGLALIKIPLTYHYSFIGAVAWFFVLLAIAIAASLGPARNAVRLTVREVLAYE